MVIHIFLIKKVVPTTKWAKAAKQIDTLEAELVDNDDATKEKRAGDAEEEECAQAWLELQSHKI